MFLDPSLSPPLLWGQPLQDSQQTLSSGEKKKKNHGGWGFSKMDWKSLRGASACLLLNTLIFFFFFFSQKTCQDWPKLLHWVMNVELVMPGDKPFQPSSIFPLMCHFIFKRDRYSRAINLLSFFTRLQPLPLCEATSRKLFTLGWERSAQHTVPGRWSNMEAQGLVQNCSPKVL